MLEARDITQRYRGRRVLDAVRLSCGAGEVCAVRGENGAGKSTLLRVLAGMTEPEAGRVFVRGHELTGGGVAARRELGYVPDGTQPLPDLSLQEFVALVRSLKRASREASAERELFGWRERLGLADAWYQRLATLSFGQRKRACTLAALIGDPWLLILDEPSNGLDPAGVGLMLEVIEHRRAQGKAAVLASNDVPFLKRLTSRRYRLEQGKLLAE